MKIAIACDHGGLDLKRTAVDYLHTHGYEVIDFGTNERVPAIIPISRFPRRKPLQTERAIAA